MLGCRQGSISLKVHRAGMEQLKNYDSLYTHSTLHDLDQAANYREIIRGHRQQTACF